MVTRGGHGSLSKRRKKKEHRMRTIKKYSPQFPLMGGKEAGVFLVVGEASKT